MVEPITLDHLEASKFLGVSERHLRTLRKRGEVPFIKLGDRVLYLADQLRHLLHQQAEANMKAAGAGEAEQAGTAPTPQVTHAKSEA